jgi:hypothetical protein
MYYGVCCQKMGREGLVRENDQKFYLYDENGRAVVRLSAGLAILPFKKSR